MSKLDEHEAKYATDYTTHKSGFLTGNRLPKSKDMKVGEAVTYVITLTKNPGWVKVRVQKWKRLNNEA